MTNVQFTMVHLEASNGFGSNLLHRKRVKTIPTINLAPKGSEITKIGSRHKILDLIDN